MWGHCFFLLGPCLHKVLFVPSKSLFPQTCVSSGGSMMGLMATSSKWAYAIPRSTGPRAPSPAASPLLTHTSSGDTQTQFCLSLCGFSGSWCAQGMFEPLERLWWVQGLILNVILPLLPSCWGFSFALLLCSSAYHLAKASLLLDVGYLLTVALAPSPRKTNAKRLNGCLRKLYK